MEQHDLDARLAAAISLHYKKPAEMTAEFRSIYRLARASGNKRVMTEALTRLADCHRIAGEIRTMVRLAQGALTMSRATGDTRSEARSLLLIANAARSRGDQTSYLEQLAHVREFAAVNGAATVQTIATIFLADAALHSGDTGRSYVLLEEALETSSAQSDTVGRLQALIALSNLDRVLLDRTTARDRLGEVIDGHSGGSSFIEIKARMGLAWIAMDDGKLDEASASLDAAWRLAEDGGFTRPKADILIGRAGIAELREDYATSLAYIEGARAQWGSSVDNNTKTEALRREAWALYKTGRIDEALAASEEGIRLAQEVDDRVQVINFFGIQSQCLEAQGRIGEALARTREYGKGMEGILTADAHMRGRALNVRLATERLRGEKEAERLRAENLQLQLESKHRELTAHAMALSRQTELLERFRKDIRTALEQADRAETAIRAIREKLKELPCASIDWGRFEAEFRETYPDFVATLTTRFPELTKMQVRVCTLVRLNLPARDIAQMLCLSERNIEGHRYRIRKALGLEKSQDLSDFLASI